MIQAVGSARNYEYGLPDYLGTGADTLHPAMQH